MSGLSPVYEEPPAVVRISCCGRSLTHSSRSPRSRACAEDRATAQRAELRRCKTLRAVSALVLCLSFVPYRTERV